MQKQQNLEGKCNSLRNSSFCKNSPPGTNPSALRPSCRPLAGAHWVLCRCQWPAPNLSPSPGAAVLSQEKLTARLVPPESHQPVLPLVAVKSHFIWCLEQSGSAGCLHLGFFPQQGSAKTAPPPPSGACTHGCWERDGRLTPLQRAAGPSELLPSPAEQQQQQPCCSEPSQGLPYVTLGLLVSYSQLKHRLKSSRTPKLKCPQEWNHRGQKLGQGVVSASPRTASPECNIPPQHVRAKACWTLLP